MNTQQAHIRVLLDDAAEEFRATEAVSLDTLAALEAEGLLLKDITAALDARLA